MSARYELRPRGVFDRERGEHIAPGHPRWGEYQAWFAAGNRPQVPDAPGPDLAQAIAAKVAEIEEKATEQRRRVTGRASPQEMASWPVKLEQARALLAGAAGAECPLVTLEAQARGVEAEAVAQRILANATAYMEAEGHIAGVAGMHKDAVRRLPSVEEVLRYPVLSGWPLDPVRPEGGPRPPRRR